MLAFTSFTPHLLTGLLAFGLVACGGDSGGSSSASPSNTASEAAADPACTTSASGVKDDPASTACMADFLNSMSFKLWDPDTTQVLDIVCAVKVGANGDVEVTVPLLGGAARILHDAPERHTSFTNHEASDTSRFQVWSGGSSANLLTGPLIEVSSSPGSNQVKVHALPYRTADGTPYIADCIGALPSE